MSSFFSQVPTGPPTPEQARHEPGPESAGPKPEHGLGRFIRTRSERLAALITATAVSATLSVATVAVIPSAWSYATMIGSFIALAAVVLVVSVNPSSDS